MKSKVVKLMVVSAVAVLAVGCFAGCGKNAATVTTGSAAEKEMNEMLSDMDMDEMMSDFADEVDSSGTNEAISVSATGTYEDDLFSFKFDPTEFTVTPGDDHSVTVSYIDTDSKTAGDNVMNISVVSGTDYKAALNAEMEKYGISDAEISEGNFAADGITAYSCTTGKVQQDGSDVSTMETVYAVPSGDNVILINVSRTLGTDEETEMNVDDGFSGILDTFTLTNAQ